jgi:hypothetical protein
MLQYKLILQNKDKYPDRYVKNIGGTLVLFREGVAHVTKQVADAARQRRGITVIGPEFIGAAVIEEDSTEVVPTVVAHEPEPTVEVAEEEEPTEEEPTVESDGAAVEDVPAVIEEEETAKETTPAEEYTKESIEILYAKYGTWAAVADHLGISVSKLGKVRKSVGL